MQTISDESRIVIYGAGKIGRRIYDLCQDRGIEIVAVWDNFPEKVLAFPKKKPIAKPVVFAPGETAADYGLAGATIIITPFSHNMAEELVKPLENRGFRRVVHDRSEISEILIQHCRWLSSKENYNINLQDCFICPARRDEHVECDVFNKSMGNVNYGSEDYVALPVLGFLLTTRCNLTCIGCNHLQDLFDKSHNVHFQRADIFNDLEKLIDAVDFVKSIVIVGGEAMLHPDFETLLRKVVALPKVGFVQLITNGTVVPKNEKVYELLSNKRVIVEISGYGDEISSKLVKKREVLFRKLTEAGIYYRYDEVMQWIDFGGFEKRNYAPMEWKEVYDKCCFVSNDLFNGQLHKCSRSAYGQFLEKTPAYKNDYVDVRALSGIELRHQIKTFIKKIPQACYHCDGTTTKTMPAGVQLAPKSQSLEIV